MQPDETGDERKRIRVQNWKDIFQTNNQKNQKQKEGKVNYPPPKGSGLLL